MKKLRELTRVMPAVIALAISVCPLHASNTPASTTEGTIVSEKSVDCGSQKKGHKKTLDLLCQEYVVHTSGVEYHVRQAKDSAKELLPVHSKINFVLNKDKMKFVLNGKKYEYRVVSEESLETKSDAGSQAR